MYMMARNAIMRITSLIIYVLVIPAQTAVWEQDTVIEYLLRKVAELETNQQECSSSQSKMLLELRFVKNKLQQSERRISELKAIVDDIRSNDYTTRMRLTLEKDAADKSTNENVTIKEETNISQIPGFKRMTSHKPGILKRANRATAMKQIGFSATIAKSIPTVYPNQIIHFDTVLHNEGNGFNKQTGTFTCPISGTYFFSVSLMAQHPQTIAIHLIVDGEIKVNSHADGGSAFDQSSVSSMVRCVAGQSVWIGVYWGTFIYGDYFTTFSGFLLWGDATGSS